MNVKLTLSIDQAVVVGIKEYAHRHGKSVSEIVENGLALLAGVKRARAKQAQVEDIEIPPFIENFHAGIKKVNVPADLDYKDVVAEMVMKKHA